MDRRQLLAGGIGMAVGSGAAWRPTVASAQAAPTPAHRADLQRQLADYGVGLRFDALPPEVVDTAKRLLLDTLGCALGAAGAAPATIAEASFRKAFGGSGAGAGSGSATIIGSATPITTEGATLVNGVLVRYLDFNDTYVGTEPLHPSEITPIALACCEEARRSGRALLEALVVGYEGEMRINDALQFLPRGFHPLSAAAFVAPLVAGKAWQLPADQIAHAIGISGTRGFTTMAVNYGDISMMKAMGHAYISMDAVFSTRMAAAGFTGPSGTVEWFATQVAGAASGLAIDLAPGAWRLPKVFLKEFPLQFEMQAAVEAAVKLNASLAGRSADIQEVVIETYPKTIERTADAVKFRPATRETADHSLPVCTAMALLDGDVTEGGFSKGRWRDADVMALVGKTSVVASQALLRARPQGRGSAVELRFKDGRVARETVEIAEGDTGRPMSRASLERKFRQLAEPVLGASSATKVIALVDTLDTLDDVRSLTEVLRGRANS